MDNEKMTYEELLLENKRLKKIAALMDSDHEGQFMQLFENIDDAFWISSQNEVNYINSAFEEIWGIPCDDIYANPKILLDVIHPDDKQTVLNILNKQVSIENRLVNYEYRIIRPDKQIRWIRAKSLLIYDENGINTKSIGTARDITKEKEIDDKLLQSENRFRKLFENMPTGVAIYKSLDNGRDFQFVGFNKAAEKITFSSKDEIINSTLLTAFPNMGEGELIMALREVEKTNRDLYIEPFHYNDDKREGWRENYLYKLSTGEIVAIFDDITERKNAEILLKNQNLELQEAKIRAEESSRLKTEFLNNMSHEVRTPMNGIIGFSEMLNKPDISEEERIQFTKIVQSSSYQLLRIIDDILEISTLETKQGKLDETEFCLNDLLKELFSIFKLVAEKQNIPLFLKEALPDSDSIIITDKTKLSKILSNIIENALRYTREGFIELGYYIESTNIVLYVKDTGVGISPQNLQLVFERFSQEDKELSREHGGLGLGLAISKESAQLLGGDITLESEKGRGSTFFISIPYKPVKNEGALLDSPLKKASITIPENFTILVAEDEEINFFYLDQLFKLESECNLTLIHANNGKEAVDLCMENREIDLVLMDIKMPVMNGLEAAMQIKSVLPNLPIIAQTAYSTESDKQLALNHGCDDFISKPINKEKLFGLLCKYLKNE